MGCTTYIGGLIDALDPIVTARGGCSNPARRSPRSPRSVAGMGPLICCISIERKVVKVKAKNYAPQRV